MSDGAAPLALPPAQGLKQFLSRDDVQGKLVEAATGLVKPQDLVRLCLFQVQKNPDIAACTPVSIIRALSEAATLDIPPTGLLGRGYLVPRNVKDKATGTFQKELFFDPGWRGFMDIALATGEVRIIRAGCVYVGENFLYEDGLQPILRHTPNPDVPHTWENVYAAWAASIMTDGTPHITVMYKSELERVRSKSTSKTGPWQDWFDEMSKKSAVRRHCKSLPIRKVEHLHRAIQAADEADALPEVEVIEGSAAQSLADRLRASRVEQAPAASVDPDEEFPDMGDVPDMEN